MASFHGPPPEAKIQAHPRAPIGEAKARAHAYRRAASERALVATLRREDPGEHLAWVRAQRRFDVPLEREQPAQLAARWVALYSLAELDGERGATLHVAEVKKIDIRSRAAGEQIVLYHLGAVEPRALPLRGPRGAAVPSSIQTSRLALDLAVDVAHLWMETAPEWHLHDQLTARGVAFRVEVWPAFEVDLAGRRRRAQLRGEGWRVRYEGAGGFEVRMETRTRWIAREEGVVAFVAAL